MLPLVYDFFNAETKGIMPPMAHKKISHDEKKLRQQVEILKAQLKTYEKKSSVVRQSVVHESDTKGELPIPQKSVKPNDAEKDKLMKRDLLKTFSLIFFCFAVIAGVWAYFSFYIKP